MFRKTKAPPEISFVTEPSGDNALVRLADGQQAVPFSEWMSRHPRASAAIAAMEAAALEERSFSDGRSMVRLNSDHAILAPAFMASLDASMAASIGLPPPTTLALDFRPVGLISDQNFRIDVRWVKPGGLPVRVDVSGAWISTADGRRRIPEPLWSLHSAACALSQPLDKSERFQRLAELRRHWPEDTRAVDSRNYLNDLRVHYASALSVKLRTLTPERTDFDPVLFGARGIGAAGDQGRSLDEEADSVLSSPAQRLFAEDRFRREATARSVYVLRDGEFVFIDPSLRPALGAVRVLQDRPEQERRAFILNPRRVLSERLGEAAEDSDLDLLFVETEQFSQRVAGVDVWRAPVLPWLVQSKNAGWLPEEFGLRIGDDYFVVPPRNVGPLLDRVEAAAQSKALTAEVADLLRPAENEGPAPPEQIPVNEQVLESVRALHPFALKREDQGAAPTQGVEETQAAWSSAYGKLFLVVRENFEEVEYAPIGERADDEAPEVDAPPSRLHTTLKTHQMQGLRWLAHCVSANRPGALLADDMGLGKTLQAIAFMAWLQDEAAAGRRARSPFLIIAPTGLLGTWRDEIVKHLDLPRLGELVPAFGSDLKTLREQDTFAGRDIETGRAALRAESWREAGVVLTTYETMRDYHFSFARTHFGLVVYDEIQKLKNPASQVTRAAKALNSEFVLGMTGTPVENRLQDLWSIMDVLTPGLLGASRDFERRHPTTDAAALSRLKAQLTEGQGSRPPYMLRRLKADALDGLPGKHVHAYQAEMPPVQASAYRQIVVRASAAAAVGAMGKGGMLSTLAAMRGVSLHPVDPRQAPADLSAYAADSARLAHTLSVLDEISAKGERALVFVEDLAMQERLAGLIQQRFSLTQLPMRINGTVPGPKRQAMVDAFQREKDRFGVMILSPRAGGVGLTLTAANHVIHLSRWWNPAVEDQATDRVFRIGQTKDVHVYLPMAVHPDPDIRRSSFDLRLDALIDRKRGLTQDLFMPPDGSDADLSELFREVSLGSDPQSPAEAGDEPDLAPASNTPPAVEPPVAQPPLPASVDSSELVRPILSLPRPVEQSGARIWRIGSGEARPTEQIVGLFRDRHIAKVSITDPYALASRAAREAQIKFIADLSRTAKSLDYVVIEYSPEVDSDLEDGAARRNFGAEFGGAMKDNASRLNLVRHPRIRGDDFHDRFVDIDVRHAGGAVRRHQVTIGRGLQALYDDRKQCTISYAPPPPDFTS